MGVIPAKAGIKLSIPGCTLKVTLGVILVYPSCADDLLYKG